MSEEDSFVILGSSPPSSFFNEPSLQTDDTRSILQLSTDDKEKKTDHTALSQSSQSKEIFEMSTSEEQNNTLIGSNVNSNSSNGASLATNFLLGEVNADILKNSIYSQFPSLCSTQACAEDVVKLQNLMTEYINLKQALSKVNCTMKKYYELTQQWREEAMKQEQQNQRWIDELKQGIKKANDENEQLKKEMQNNMEHMKLANEIHQKENDELRQNISHKISMIENMRIQIDKIERQQLQSYEFLSAQNNEIKPTTNFIELSEHERIIKSFEQKMNDLVDENYQIKYKQNTYIDEINCLKLNLTSAKELFLKTHADVELLQTRETAHEEELAILRQQVEIYRRDFEMERADREKNAGEKAQYLQELRLLQRRNQELIEALAVSNKRNSKAIPQLSAAVNKVILRENQRPVRVLDPNTDAAALAAPKHRCPVCLKTFNCLNILESHVNDCLDKN